MNITTRKWLEIIRFEVGYQLGRKATWFFFAAFLMPLMGQTNGQVIHASGGEVLFNAPLLIAESSAWMSLIALVVIAAVAGDAATRDVQLRMESLMHAAPLGRAAYLGGRFIGAFLVIALLLVAVPLASIVFPYVHPDLDAELVGPFRAAVYLQSYFVLIVPNAFVATALLFALATLLRHTLGSYAGAALMVAGTLFSMQFVAKTLNQWELAKLLDPVGIVALHVMEETWSPIDLNARLIGPEPALLWNRLLWLAVAFAVLAFTYTRFRFGAPRATFVPRGARRSDRQIPEPADNRQPTTDNVCQRDFGVAARVRQTLTAIHCAKWSPAGAGSCSPS